MEVNDTNLAALAQYLDSTMNPDAKTRRQAEDFLVSVEKNAGYPVLLLCLIQKPEAPLTIRVAGSITLKNFVKRNWNDDKSHDGSSMVHENDKVVIKKEIVQLMLAAPEAVQRQISEVISLIGRKDFPGNWNELLPTLIEQLGSTDSKIVNSVLQTAHSLFKRYQHEMKSDQLWLEIKYVLGLFAAPLTDLFVQRAALAQKEAGNPSAELLTPIFTTLSLITKIFYSLNVQDLPEFFEDNMNIWMPGFLGLLQLEVPALVKSTEEEEAGVLEQLKSQICNSITLYAQKYQEEFEAHLPPFVGVVWHLLVSTSSEKKYDILVAGAMQFLTIVAEREKYKSLFEKEALSQICEKVVVPNMEFRQIDMEAFEDNPEEFIRKDIEGSDVDTRRRSSADLVKALCKFFEPEVTQIFSVYIQQLFAEYAADPRKNWVKKDVAVFIVTSLAAKGSTAKHGTTKTSNLVNLVEFFQTQIAPELAGDNVNDFPVLKAAALKYLVTFRMHFPKDLIVESLRHVTRFLTAESVVVHTYAAHALERVFTVRNPQQPSQPLIQYADVQALAGDLLTNIFSIFEKPESKENEYAMKALMRCLTLFHAACATYSDIILTKLTQIVMEVAKNPSKPHFNHYLFESLCVLIKQACKSSVVDKFEEALFPPFQLILQEDVLEFMPYIFQILAMMLDMRSPGAGIPDSYMKLFPFLLVPAVWERQGSVPALVLFMRAYIKVGTAQIIEGNHLNPLLGVFQKLIASKVNDHEGFKLLNALVEFGSYEQLQGSVKAILTVLFNRLQALKTQKFTKSFIIFMCTVSVKWGPEKLVHHVDEIQPNIFGMILEKIIIVDLQKISGGLEKKICSVGIIKLVCECPDLFMNGKYCNHWVPLLEAIVGMFELPEEGGTEEDEQLLDLDENAGGYSAAFSQLAYAQASESDPTGVSDAKAYLVTALQNYQRNRPGEVGPLLGKLQPKAADYIKAYLTAAGVHL